MSFRVAIRPDIPRMMAIRDGVRENRLVSGVLTADDYARAITIEGRAFVCDDAQARDVVGFVCGRPSHADIWALFVRPSHEGRGIGNELMRLVETWMFDQGVARISLTTDPGTRAERLYQRRGWQHAGTTHAGEARYTLARRG